MGLASLPSLATSEPFWVGVLRPLRRCGRTPDHDAIMAPTRLVFPRASHNRSRDLNYLGGSDDLLQRRDLWIQFVLP